MRRPFDVHVRTYMQVLNSEIKKTPKKQLHAIITLVHTKIILKQLLLKHVYKKNKI